MCTKIDVFSDLIIIWFLSLFFIKINNLPYFRYVSSISSIG